MLCHTPAVTQPRPGSAAFVVLAAGAGTRVGGPRNKVYLPLAGRPVVAWSLAWAAAVPAVGPVLLVIRPGDEDEAARAVAAAGLAGVEVLRGASTRHGSEAVAFAALADRVGSGAVEVIAVHDGARPLAGADLLGRVIAAAVEHGGAVPTVPEPRAWSLAGSSDGPRLRPPPTPLHRVQTPQAFRAGPLLAAHARAAAGTDTAAALEAVTRVVAVPGHEDNLKVTFADDVPRAESRLRRRSG